MDAKSKTSGRIRINIQLKITSLILFLVILMMGIITYVFTIRELKLQREQVTLRMQRLASNIATIRSVETQDWDTYQTYIDNQINLNQDIVYIAIFDEQGDLKVHALNADWIDIDPSQPFDSRVQSHIVRQLDQRQIAEESRRDLESQSVNIVLGGQNSGKVNVGFSLVELNDQMQYNLFRNLLLGGVFSLLAICVSIIMSRRIVNPLKQFTQAMLKISHGDVDQKLDIKTRDEIGEMAHTFNFMTKGLREKRWIETLTRKLGFTVELDHIAHLLTDTIAAALEAKAALLFIRSRHDQAVWPCVSCVSSGISVQSLRQNTAMEVIHTLSEGGKAQIGPLTDFPSLEAHLAQLEAFGDNALIYPIAIKDDMLGLFVLGDGQTGVPYTDEERTFLMTLLAQGGMAIENVLLMEDLTEQERLKRELEIARKVQAGLLPQWTPTIEGLDIDGICQPATEVGGDYFDYFPVDDHTLGIVIADVTGKGTSAAFHMAVVKGMMLSLASVFTSPRQLLIELNRKLFRLMDRHMFVTMSYALIDTKHNIMTFARAGHCALINKNSLDSDVELIIPEGIGLGMGKGHTFDDNITEKVIHLNRNDLFIFYTDGISEAMNNQREEYGEERLIQTIETTEQQDAQTIRNHILKSVQDFTQDAVQHDDITMVVLRVR